MEYVRNPVTGRRIKVGGRVYNQLLKDRVIVPPAAVAAAAEVEDLTADSDSEAAAEKNPIPNEAFMATLDSLDSWEELEPWRLFRTQVNGYAFDLLFLIQSITTQLNQIKSNNPFPVYPSNPFTKQPLHVGDLTRLKDAISRNGIKTSAVLEAFLASSSTLWSDSHERIESTDWLNACISVFKGRRMRYVRNIEQIGNDDNDETKLVGYWDLSSAEVTNNEYWSMLYVDDPVAAMGFENMTIVQPHLIPFMIPTEYYFCTRV